MHGHMNVKSKLQFVFLMGEERETERERGGFCNIYALFY
jgi:hypothetical protein